MTFLTHSMTHSQLARDAHPQPSLHLTWFDVRHFCCLLRLLEGEALSRPLRGTALHQPKGAHSRHGLAWVSLSYLPLHRNRNTFPDMYKVSLCLCVSSHVEIPIRFLESEALPRPLGDTALHRLEGAPTTLLERLYPRRGCGLAHLYRRSLLGSAQCHTGAHQGGERVLV